MTTWNDCRAAYAKHPREVCCIGAALSARDVWRDGEDWSLAALWAIDCAENFAKGIVASADASVASDAAYAAYVASDAAYAAYDADASDASDAVASVVASVVASASDASAASASAAAYPSAAAYSAAISRLPLTIGSWGVWRESHGIAKAGDYLMRLDPVDGAITFIERDDLEPHELIALDEILER